MDTQSRVSNWVSGQSSEASNYSSPFQLTPSQASDPSRFEFYSSKSKHAGRSRSHSSTETARPPPRRSNTDHGHGRRHHRHHDNQTSSHSRSATTTSATASTTTTTTNTSSKRHNRARSATTNMYYTASSDATAVPTPVRSQTMPITTVPGGQKIMLPLGEPGQTYLIIPTRGNQIDVVASSPTSDTKIHHYPTGASSPIKKSLPLFKRLLSSFTNSQDRSLSPSSSRTGSSRSRSQEGVRSWTLVDMFDPNSSGSTLVEDSERKSKSSRSSGSKAYVESGGKQKRSRESGSRRERSGSR